MKVWKQTLSNLKILAAYQKTSMLQALDDLVAAALENEEKKRHRKKMRNQYWKHNTSGEVYAVQTKNSYVHSACGPLHHREVTPENLETWNFNNDPELADDLDSNQADYHLVEFLS